MELPLTVDPLDRHAIIQRANALRRWRGPDDPDYIEAASLAAYAQAQRDLDLTPLTTYHRQQLARWVLETE